MASQKTALKIGQKTGASILWMRPIVLWLWLFSHNFDRPLSTLIVFFFAQCPSFYFLRLRCKKVEQFV